MITGGYHDVAGVRVFVETAGEGHPVVCIHTAGQFGIQWRHVLDELPGHGHRVVVPDLPGHGRSMPFADGPARDLGRYTSWLLELLGELALERPYVVGCSIGGKIALEVAARAGDRVAGVVAMCCDARNTLFTPRALERGIEDSASPSRTDRTYLGTYASVGRSVPRERVEAMAVLHRREDPVVTTSDLIGWVSHDLRELLPAAACPVTVVAGEDDFWVDPADAQRAAGLVPDGRYELLERIGHYPMEEMADFSARLDGWIADLARRGGAGAP